MKITKRMSAVAKATMVAAVLVVGAATAHADLVPRKKSLYLESATDMLPRKRSQYIESATDLRKRNQYFADVVLIQIVIRQRNEWFAKASNLVRRPQ